LGTVHAMDAVISKPSLSFVMGVPFGTVEPSNLVRTTRT
jgi:hypothetical protein